MTCCRPRPTWLGIDSDDSHTTNADPRGCTRAGESLRHWSRSHHYSSFEHDYLYPSCRIPASLVH